MDTLIQGNMYLIKPCGCTEQPFVSEFVNKVNGWLILEPLPFRYPIFNEVTTIHEHALQWIEDLGPVTVDIERHEVMSAIKKLRTK